METENKPIKICKETADFICYIFRESITAFGHVSTALIKWAKEYAKSDSRFHQH